MKRIFSFILTIVLIEISLVAPGAALNEPLPQVVGRNWDNKLVSLRREFSGKPMVINFWAQWCAPCKKELPELVNMETQFKGVDFIFVHSYTDPETKRPFTPKKLEEFLKSISVSLKHSIITGTRNGTNAGIEAYPTTLLINSNGMIDQKLLEYSPENMEKLRSWLLNL